MDSREEHLRKFLRLKDIDAEGIISLSGSSNCLVFLLGDKVYKVGPAESCRQDLLAYNIYDTRLRTQYQSFFPPFNWFWENDDELAILVTGYVGEISLETLLDRALASAEHEPEFIKFLQITLRKLNELNYATYKRWHQDYDKTRFFIELVRALELNLRQADLYRDKEKGVIAGYTDYPDVVLKEFIPSITHRDFHRMNVIVTPGGDDVRFIDPRFSVPHLEKMRARGLGNIALDLVTLKISLKRRFLEYFHTHGRDGSPDCNRVASLWGQVREILSGNEQKQIQAGIFTRKFYGLCMTVWYSVYAACRCEYCMSPERRWLYDRMVRDLRVSLRMDD